MHIDDNWSFEDAVSGLKFSVKAGNELDCLHLERTGEPICGNRDLFFTKDGKFDGTGSSVDGCDGGGVASTKEITIPAMPATIKPRAWPPKQSSGR